MVATWTPVAAAYPSGSGLPAPPIGRPLTNVRVQVLDRRQRPVPLGVAGELHVAGASLARGYRHRRRLTAEKFVPDAYSAAGDRLYRTGDLVRHLADGALEFLGRIDHQVKVRGYRIELGEIEAVLLEHPDVLEAVAAVCAGRNGHPRLAAYVVPRSQGAASPASFEARLPELRTVLRSRLPEHMVPASFVLLEALPKTPNGKLDRRSLPAPEDVRQGLGNEYAAPSTPTEKQVAEIWAEVLGVDRVGLHDSFFDLGGHSLLATQMIVRLRQAFGIEDLPLVHLFQQPTVAGLALAITEIETRRDGEDAALQMLEELRDLSPEEIAELLREELQAEMT